MHKSQLEDNRVVIYSDGACSGNPGHGGYGAVLLFLKEDILYTKELSQGYKLTTNNRMELMGVIRALQVLKRPSRVSIYSDSKYVVDAVNKSWLKSWKKRGWKNSTKKDVKNQDLWKELDEQLSIHDIKFFWVKGHAGELYNEQCDTLAVNASRSLELKKDSGYKGD